MTVFDILDGQKFVWKGRTYTLLAITDDARAIVTEDGVEGQQYFNPYAEVMLHAENDNENS